MAQSQGNNPAAPADVPGLPVNADFFDLTGFDGIDTKPPRPAVQDNHVAWCNNLMPLGANNIRALPDIGDSIYTAGGGLTITYFDFFILQPGGVFSGPSMCIFLSDGSAVSYDLNTATPTAMAAAGTFSPPAGLPVAVRQFGTKFLTIAVEVENGYWIWDGSHLFTAGTVGPEVDLTATGDAVTGTPSVTFYGGTGTGATFTASVANSAVTEVTVNNPGSGWLVTDPPKVILVFSDGTRSTAYGTATVVNGAIVAIEIASGGSGFTSIPTVTITDGTGSGAFAVVSSISSGVITGITVTQCGSGYSAPTIGTTGGGGSGLVASARLDNGVIDGITIISGGSAYLSQPAVEFISATGSGASATAVLSSGAVTGLDFGIGAGQGFTGSGYSGQVLVAFKGGGGVPSGTVQLMPFGVDGHAIEVYQSRVWLTTSLTGVKTFFTAPGSVVNFGPPDGGGVFPANDADLRYTYANLLQSNGFLYLLGDSSVNYVSGVQTSGSPALTTFSNLNVDPDVGTPWRDSAITFGRAIVMANTIGVYAIYGGSVQKISNELDGVFDTGDRSLVLDNPSSAKCEIYGVKVYLLLLPIIDPVTGQAVNALMMWDGKRWFTATPQVTLTKIRTLEIGSAITAYGTDGTNIFPLFQTLTTATTKTLQSKMWVKPTIVEEKKSWMMYALWQSYATAVTLSFTVDTERGSANVTQGPFASGANAIGYGRSKVSNAAGFAMGFTMTSTSQDFTLMYATLMGQDYRLKT